MIAHRMPEAFALRGPFLTCTGDPFRDGVEATRHYEPDGIVAIDDGHIVDAGPARHVQKRLAPGTPIERLRRGTLLVPGFIDCHVHYAQLAAIASYGSQLIDWLERYTYPAERALAKPEYARSLARQFFDATLACGTTTAATYCSVHASSVDAFFDEASRRGVRAIAGKVLMDRHAPPGLVDTAQRGYDESKAAIARWHGRGRLGYAITPRFAPTSSPAQLEAASALWREHPGCWLQSHLAESRREVAWVRELFPQARDYVDVYARFDLLGRRAIYGHGIHLCERELSTLAETGSALVHCPTSNLFLGSGIFSWRRAKKSRRPLRVGIGTDVGGGTSLSMLATLGDAYKVAQLDGMSLAPALSFYLATRGGAQALDLEGHIGSIAPGIEADLVVLDLEATPLLAQRIRHAASLDDALFALFTLGDDRAVDSTFVAGRCVHRRDGSSRRADRSRGHH